MSKFYCNNDKCKLHNKEIQLFKYKSIVSGDKLVYRDSTGDIIHCKECRKSLVISIENKGICANFKSRMNVNKPVNLDSWEDMNRQDDMDAMGFDPRKK